MILDLSRLHLALERVGVGAARLSISIPETTGDPTVITIHFTGYKFSWYRTPHTFCVARSPTLQSAFNARG